MLSSLKIETTFSKQFYDCLEKAVALKLRVSVAPKLEKWFTFERLNQQSKLI